MSGPANSRRQGRASQRAQRVDQATRALSVAIPVSAYILRYSFEISRKAKRAPTDFTTRERFQICAML
jgi:hypothetical protein